ncbi:PREDICTED: uncharacterized protein LOC105155081 [Acromyrmex echinatior]|uniref:uncharacterized protein LOC105155081 n=1 Tax=Acromyrmex echinatior TaxID=103372 RepID=UPI000580CDBD|nr:PREDICTED: uncharacterized protein LOC105155081 [Acromyrmex echinatior]
MNFEFISDLLAAKINRTARTFVHTGVDYADSIAVGTTPSREHKSQKAYIALFVCLTTKATFSVRQRLYLFYLYRSVSIICFLPRTTEVHVFQQQRQPRFTAPIASCPMHMRKQFTILTSAIDSLPTELRGTSYSPASPHFGGLWKATVKSIKHHLKRCIGLHTLIVEEMSTLLCRIEACLNSRRIAPVSDNFEILIITL